MSYTNSDGLFILTHGAQGSVQDKGVTAESARQTLVVDVPSMKAIGTTFGAANIDPNDAFIPAGSVILSATWVTTTEITSGGGATLDIGTYNAAGTAIDADGIDAAVALTAINGVGETVRCDGAHLTVGGYVAANAYIGMIYAVAAYTAGAGKLVIEYVKVA
jgi:hypothetical protein